MFIAKQIQFTDTIGPITDRMCLRCDCFVYLNTGCDPNGKYDVWVFLCVMCNERLLPIETESQAQRTYRIEFAKRIPELRLEFVRKQAQERAKRHKKEKLYEGEQQKLWD